MSLPSGYTRLEYIESHGTEYFDTGFVPNGNSRVVMDFEVTSISSSSSTSSLAVMFGARTSSNANAFAMWLSSTTVYPQYGNVGYNTNPITISTEQRLTYDLDKGVATVGGSSVTFTNLTFSAGCNLTLFAINTNNVVDDRRVTGKLYSAKVYDNNTLVRDFIPAMNASGTIGLWDDVNSTFYTNAGTGTLTTGKKHKTRIDGTGYEVKGGRVLIGGTGYSIKKGRTLIGGTGYDISFNTPVGELDVGTSVYIDVGGVSTELLVVHQGNPDTNLYNNTCNGTWMMMKNIYTMRPIDANSVNGMPYMYTDIHEYANNDFLTLLDEDIQGLIKQVTIPLDISGGAQTVSCKVFLPMLDEVNLNHYADHTPSPLSYFQNATTDQNTAEPLRVAKYNGQASVWAGRDTFYYNVRYSQYAISAVGKSAIYNQQTELGFRPFWIFPSEEAKIDGNFNIVA